jgi:hypothetical protein
MHDHEQVQRHGSHGSHAEESVERTLASQVGNAGIARLLEGQGVQRSAGGPAKLDNEIARAIDEQRGRGSELDGDARTTLESAMGEDFSDVRIHHDDDAHELSKSVHADAFTTGSDVFFQSGKYDPGSSAGQKLLAHELTHVVQQRGAADTSEMTVSDPGDAHEVEAASIADKISAAPPAGQAAASVSREAEEEEVATSRVDREGAEEEETPQA